MKDLKKDVWIVTGCLTVLAATSAVRADKSELPEGVRYRSIKINEPQLFMDDYLIGNRYNEEYISARVAHVLHRGERLKDPVLIGDDDKPWERRGIHRVSVLYDAYADLFRTYYTIHNFKDNEAAHIKGYCMGHAASKDGLHWEKPLTDIVPWGPQKKTNIILRGQKEAKIMHVHSARATGVRPDGQRVCNIGMLPPENLKGHRFIAYYGDREHYLATSEDGIHFEPRQQQILPNRVDCYQTIVYDPAIDEYVIFYRNKLIYDDDHGAWRKGNHRMITRLSSPELWTLWDSLPDTVLIPEGDDAGRFYGMPTFRYGGVYFGMLEQYGEDPQKIEVELVWSRDGFHWERAPGRPMLISVGEDGTWDDGMVFAADRVIERNDEWWLYYIGVNGYHDSSDNEASLGLIKFRKEGFVSIRADTQGQESYVITRPILWPGGELVINADTQSRSKAWISKGYVKVAVTDLHRKLYNGFTYDDSVPFNGNAVRHTMKWKNAHMDTLKGKLVRLEFAFKHADLFAFLAQKGESRP